MKSDHKAAERLMRSSLKRSSMQSEGDEPTAAAAGTHHFGAATAAPALRESAISGVRFAQPSQAVAASSSLSSSDSNDDMYENESSHHDCHSKQRNQGGKEK